MCWVYLIVISFCGLVVSVVVPTVLNDFVCLCCLIYLGICGCLRFEFGLYIVCFTSLIVIVNYIYMLGVCSLVVLLFVFVVLF